MTWDLTCKVLNSSQSRQDAVDELITTLGDLVGARTHKITVQNTIYLLLERLTAWVVDLPASERSHHRVPFGLIDHSLDTAVRLVRGIEQRLKNESGTVHCTHPMRSRDPINARLRWYPVGVGLALFHDIGKVVDFTVLDPRSGQKWDPYKEPLGLFRTRHGSPMWGNRDYRWIRGRGAKGHDERVVDLGMGMLPPGFSRDFQRDLRDGLDHCLCRPFRELGEFTSPFGYFIKLVRDADSASARNDVGRRNRA